jgi:hypothetical protein
MIRDIFHTEIGTFDLRTVSRRIFAGDADAGADGSEPASRLKSRVVTGVPAMRGVS